MKNSERRTTTRRFPFAFSILNSLLPIAVLILLTMLFFWRVLTPVQADRLTFQQGDFTLQFLAYRQMAFRQWQAGRIPVFEECIYSGYPFQADPQAQVLYPPVLGLMLLGRALGWSEYPLRALEWEVMLHVLLAALAMYAFLRLMNGNRRDSPVWLPHYTGSPPRRMACLIGAVAYAFGGFMTGYAMLQTAILETAAWLPLILLALKWLATARRWWPAAVLLAVLVFFAFTAGHPQTLLFVVYTGMVAFAFWLYQAHRGEPRGTLLKRGLLRGGVAGIFAIGLAAAQLIPTLSFMLASTRTTLPFTEAGRGFALQDIAMFVLTGAINVWQPLYIGIITLALAGVAVTTSARPHRSQRPVRSNDVWLWVAIGVGALVLSFGANAFGFDLAYLAAPGYRQFQAQERHAIIITLALSVLAAYGAHALLRPLRWRAIAKVRRAARSLALWGAVAFAAMMTVLIAQRVTSASEPNDLGLISDRVAIIAIGLLGTAALFAWRARLGKTPRWLWGSAALALLVFDLFSVNRLTATQPFADPFPPNALIDPIIQTYAPETHSRIYNHFGLPLNGACVRGLNEVGGGSPIVLRDYQRFLEGAPEDVMVKLLNVRHAVTWRGAMTTPEGVEIPWFLLARDKFEGRGASTYRLDWEPQSFNGVWIAKTPLLEDDDEAMFTAMRKPGFDPFATAFVRPRDLPASGAPLPSGQGNAAIEGKAPGYFKVAVSTGGPMLLVLSEAYHWNWVASAFGDEFRPIVVNGALLGALLPGSTAPYSIEFTYRPTDLYIGAAISGMTLLTMIVSLILTSRRDPHDRRDTQPTTVDETERAAPSAG